MKQTIFFSLLLLFSFISFGQPPNGTLNTPQSTNHMGVTENGLNLSKEKLNVNVNFESNSLLKLDSSYFNVNQKFEEREDSNEQDDTKDLRETDKTVQVFSAFSLVRQNSKLNKFQRTPLAAEQAEMDAKVKQLELISPHSWEYPLAYYLAGNYNLDRSPALEKAYQMNPENLEVQKQYVSLKLMNGDTISVQNALAVMSVNNVITLEVETYTSDVLTSCAMNSTLITHGFEDTYGALLNQFSYQQRLDVNVVSLDFMQSPQYRKALEGKGYVLPKSTKIDVGYLSQFCYLNADKGLFLSVTIPRNYLEPISKKLFPVGLTFQYANAPALDLPSRQETFWFEQFNKYGLTESEERSKFAMNYIPMLMYLEQKYIQEGNEVLLLQIRESMDFILGKKVIKKAGN
ncbi:MAG: hypothetical protein KA736_10120 [Crocinitomicaceae bacterium]|nr:hypothetical protein [Crocinitomicaceae bacterium]MBP6033407.1 hypothetical protein [Crocinitomicaceae bacterium]